MLLDKYIDLFTSKNNHIPKRITKKKIFLVCNCGWSNNFKDYPIHLKNELERSLNNGGK